MSGDKDRLHSEVIGSGTRELSVKMEGPRAKPPATKIVMAMWELWGAGMMLWTKFRYPDKFCLTTQNGSSQRIYAGETSTVTVCHGRKQIVSLRPANVVMVSWSLRLISVT